VKGLLSALTSKYEAHREHPWQIEGAPSEFIEKLTKAIVTFEIPIERIEGKFKLGQNRSLDDRRGTVTGLQQENTPEAQALADFMRAFGGLGDGTG
jgi:transcriptional regulator